MSDNIHVEIIGIDDVCKDLENLGTVAGTTALTAGLGAAGQVIEEYIAGAIETKLEEHTGDLLADLDKVVTVDDQGRGGYVDVGFSSAQEHVARFVEWGHRMVGHRPGLKDLGKQIPPHPFMREGGDAAAEPATEAFANKFNDVMAAAIGDSEEGEP